MVPINARARSIRRRSINAPPRSGPRSEHSRSLLTVEDDTPLRERLVRAMRDRGYETRGVPDHVSALDAAREESPELALVDLRLPGESGLTVIRELKELDPSTVVVVLTGYGSIATAVESIKLGAASYLTKPADADQIVAAFDGPAGGQHRSALPGARRVGAYPARVDRLRRERFQGRPRARHPSPILQRKLSKYPSSR